MIGAYEHCKGVSNFSIFCKPSIVELHLCKLPDMCLLKLKNNKIIINRASEKMNPPLLSEEKQY